MSASFRREYAGQLPKFSPWTLERTVGLLGSLGSIASIMLFFSAWDDISEKWQYFIVSTYLLLLLLLVSVYTILRKVKSRRRYKEAIFYLHLVNHTIRDYLAEMDSGTKPRLNERLQEIIDGISACFSVVVGRQCRCCIKEYKSTGTVITVVRNNMAERNFGSTTRVDHELDKNTALSNVYYGIDGCLRMFLSNDLTKFWLEKDYKNTSFQVYGDPEAKTILSLKFVRRWPLPYKSTIVWPIRYIPDYTLWPPTPPLTAGAAPTGSAEASQKLWGFLCVDCNSRNAFDALYCPELGAGFADALYILFDRSARAAPG